MNTTAIVIVLVAVVMLNYLVGWYCEKIERDEKKNGFKE